MSALPQESNSLRQVAAFLLIALLVGGCDPEQRDPERLRFGVPPLGDAQSTRRMVDPVAAYLSRSLGMPVDIVTTPGPEELVKRFRAGEIDLVLCSAVPVIELHENPGVDVLATRIPSEHVAVGFLARIDDTRTSLAAFRGSTVVVGVHGPSTAIVMAWQHLHERGLDPSEIISAVRVAGNSQLSIEELLSARADLAITPMFLVDTLAAAGEIPAERLRIIETTEPHPDVAYASSLHLSAELRRRIRDALLALSPDDPDGAQVLSVQAAQALVPARIEDFGRVRHALDVYRRESNFD